jgi:[calcium/calmodulin-dependent protein kinase] kinase
LNHPNVVKIHEVIDDPEQDRIYLVFEFIDGGELMDLRMSGGEIKGERMSEAVAKGYFRQLVSALEYLHDNKVLHRDIKPANCLLTRDGVLKLSDFGVSKFIHRKNNDESNDDITLKDSSGTPAFTPPEACASGGFKGKPADIWAVGITLYVMIFGVTPFRGEGTGPGMIFSLYRAIQDEVLPIPNEPTISPELKLLFTRLLDKNPRTRIKLTEIMSHPWVETDAEEDTKEIQRSSLNSKQFKELRMSHKGLLVSVTRSEVESAIHTKNPSSQLFIAGKIPAPPIEFKPKLQPLSPVHSRRRSLFSSYKVNAVTDDSTK